jgi:hypothetical protein
LVSTNKIFNACDERPVSVDADGGMPGAMSSRLPATDRTKCSQNGGRPAAVGAHIVERVRQR